MKPLVSLAFTMLGIGLVAGCKSTAATAPMLGQPVSFRLTAGPAPAAASGPLAISSFRLVVGETSLGSGDQFGCADCTNDGPEIADVPEVVSVPLNGTPVELRTEQVQPGTYSLLEVSVVAPTPQVLASAPGWPSQASMILSGTYNGRAFELALPIEGTFQERLATPVVIGAGGGPATVQVTITLPVASWFSGPSGSLDPTDPAQRTAIEANARASFSAAEHPEKPGTEPSH